MRNFGLRADQIKPLATGHGARFVLGRILVDGLRVSHMYLQTPDPENLLEKIAEPRNGLLRSPTPHNPPWD